MFQVIKCIADMIGTKYAKVTVQFCVEFTVFLIVHKKTTLHWKEKAGRDLNKQIGFISFIFL